MPEDFQRYGETWAEHHRGWEMRLWTDENLPPLRHPEAVHRANSATERSNLLRYEALREFGGVYVDTDFECLKALDPLLGGVAVFAARSAGGGIKSGIMGAVPKHPLMERAAREASQLVGEREGPWHPGLKPIGPKFFERLTADFPEVRIFESEKFYPYSHWETPRPSHEYRGAYAIHHWARTGRAPENLSADEMRATIVMMREMYTRVKDRKSRIRAQASRRKTQAERARRSADELAVRLSAAEERLAAVERSLWWRLRPARILGLGPGADPGRAGPQRWRRRRKRRLPT